MLKMFSICVEALIIIKKQAESDLNNDLMAGFTVLKD
jgi:hypothetical protein